MPNDKVEHPVKLLRYRRNMSQVDFANIIGISQGSLSKIENGIQHPSLEVLYSLSENLGVSLTRFIRLIVEWRG